MTKPVIFSIMLLLGGLLTLRLASEDTATARPVTIKQVEINWESMDHDARAEYMRHVVMPKMRKLFSDFDAEKFPKINCKTCHGEGATNETFKMPNPKLPKLPVKNDGWAELNEKHPEMMKFMMQTVKPTMAQLLNIPAKDEKNPKGFGCTNCHTME